MKKSFSNLLKICSWLIPAILLSTGAFAQKGVGVNTTTPKSILDINGSLAMKTDTITSSVTLDSTYCNIACRNSSPITITLPKVNTCKGRYYFIKKSGSSTVTLNAAAGNTVDGYSSLSLPTYADIIQIVSDGNVKWIIIDNGPASPNLAYWMLTGNSGTTAGTNFIGTTDAVDFITKTNNTERIRVASGGKIGIGGVSSPSYDLSFIGTSAKTIGLERHTTAASLGSNLTINAGGAYSGGTNLNGGNTYISSGTATGTGSSDVYIQTATAGASGTADNAPSTKVTVKGSGNVGIGTTSPTNTIDIAGTVRFEEAAAITATAPTTTIATLTNSQIRLTGTPGANFTISITATAYDGQRLVIYNTTANDGTLNSQNIVTGTAVEFVYSNTNWRALNNLGTDWHITGNSGTTAGTNFIGTTDAVDFVTKTNNSEKMRVTSGGRIGIGGLSSPSYDVAIIGTAAKTIGMERHTTAATAGNNLTINAGGSYTGGTNLNGGNTYLSSGTATGTGSSDIYLQTATAGASGTADNAPSTKVTVKGSGNVGIGNTAPTNTLDIAGTVRFEEAAATVTAVAPTTTIASLTNSQIRLSGTPGANFTISITATAYDGQRLVIYNPTANDATLNSQSIPAGTAIEFVYSNTNWRTLNNLETDWHVTGNGGTTAGTNFIGTSDAVDFVTKTNNSEKMRITSAGRIGIGGVSSPSYDISIIGTAAKTIGLERHTTAATAGSNLTINAGGAYSGGLNLNGGNTTIASGTATGTGSSDIILQTATAGSSGTTDAAPSTKMTIKGSGNVGIGTTSPSNTLHVYAASNPLRIEGLQTSTSISDKALVVDATGVVKTAIGSSSGFAGYLNADFTAASTTVRKITVQTELYDFGSEYNNSTGSFVPASSGTYQYEIEITNSNSSATNSDYGSTADKGAIGIAWTVLGVNTYIAFHNYELSVDPRSYFIKGVVSLTAGQTYFFGISTPTGSSVLTANPSGATGSGIGTYFSLTRIN